MGHPYFALTTSSSKTHGLNLPADLYSSVHAGLFTCVRLTFAAATLFQRKLFRPNATAHSPADYLGQVVSP